MRTSKKPNIWQSIKIEDDEREYLFQLKELVDTASLSGTEENNDDLQESKVEVLVLDKLKSMNNADIGGNIKHDACVGINLISFV